MIKIGDQLKSFFKGAELTQETIAGRLGVSQAYVGALLNDRQQFGKKQAQKWSDEFGISSNWLLTGIGPMLNSPKNPFSQMTEQEIEDITTDVFAEELMKLYESGEIYSAKQYNSTIAEKDKRIEELLRENWELKKKINEPI